MHPTIHSEVLALIDAGKVLDQKSYSDGNGLVLHIKCPYGKLRADFTVRYCINGRRGKRKLGEYPQMSLNEAQALCAHVQAEISRGFSPQLAIDTYQRTLSATTVNELISEYQRHHLIPYLKSAKKVMGVINKHIAPVIGNMKISDVRIRHAYALIENASSVGVKSAILTSLRQLFEFAYQFDLVEKNYFRELSRKRFKLKPPRGAKTLSALEITSFFNACSESDMGRADVLAMALFMSLAVRKCELLKARWSEFNLEGKCWNLPPQRTKEKQGIGIPLASPVIQWLKELRSYNPTSEFLFPARKQSGSPTIHESTLNRLMKPILRRLNINIHGTRHLAYTLMESLSIPKHIREICLNHRNGKGDSDTYSHYSFFEERKEAHEKLANLISAHVPAYQAI